MAAVARDHDLIVISDEVWEHILLDGQRFTPLATLPGMAERTLKIGSAGKIFSLTGWKIGWMVAQPEMASVAARAHQFLTFATAPNLQAAVAFGLDEGDAWIEPMRERFARARDRMADRAAKRRAMRCSTAPRPISCASTLQASGIALDDEAFAAAGGRAGRRGGRAAVGLRRGRPAAPHGPPVLRQARRDHRRRRRRDGQGQGDAGMSPAEEAAEILEQLGVDGSAGELVSRLADRRAADRAGGDRRSRRSACERAAKAFLDWRTVPAPRRGELVRLLGEELRAAKEPLARLVTLESRQDRLRKASARSRR